MSVKPTQRGNGNNISRSRQCPQTALLARTTLPSHRLRQFPPRDSEIAGFRDGAPCHVGVIADALVPP